MFTYVYVGVFARIFSPKGTPYRGLDTMIALAEHLSHSHCPECLGCEDSVSLWFSQDSSGEQLGSDLRTSRLGSTAILLRRHKTA